MDRKDVVDAERPHSSSSRAATAVLGEVVARALGKAGDDVVSPVVTPQGTP